MRRRSRSKPISLMTAVLVELGTMIGIIALAQPTWTRGLIEHVAAPAIDATAETYSPATVASVDQNRRTTAAHALPNHFTQWQPATPFNSPASSFPSAAWEQTTQHVARAEPAETRQWSTSQNSPEYPVLPPPASNFYAPRSY